MKVLIYGIRGRMGRVLFEEVMKDSSLIFAGGISRVEGDFIKSNLEDFKNVDVIIDFSHPNNLNKILKYAIDNNVALVLATTGYNEEQFLDLGSASNYIPIIYSENYSLGINTIINSLDLYLNSLNNFDIGIMDIHHKNKLDKPSGTAIKLKKKIESKTNNNVEVLSLRVGNVVGTHCVSFSGEDEIIEITHRVTSKRVFALGAIKAAKFINQKKSGLYSLMDLIGGK